MKRNNAVLGFIIGAVAPLIGVFLVYMIKYHEYGIKEFFSAILENHKAAATVLSLSLLINLIPFLYYSNKRIEETSKGVLIATMLYFVLFLLLKFVW